MASAHIRTAMLVVLGPLLAGCGDGAAPVDPVDWWHNLQGGQIAAARPPPPNVDQPYPNLATIPVKPQPIDPATRARIGAGLVADRANAQYAASLSPLVPPPAASPAPRVQASGQPPTASASLPAAEAPANPPPPRPAPVRPVQTAPLAAPAAADPGPAPDMPASPPAPPQLAGVPASTAPIVPPVAPPPPPPAAAPPGAPVPVAFAPGSAVLSADAGRALRALAGQRGQQSIAVIGYGEAASDSSGDQSAALPLALARARGIAAALVAAGVPGTAVRVSAQAIGSGGVARLVP